MKIATDFAALAALQLERSRTARAASGALAAARAAAEAYAAARATADAARDDYAAAYAAAYPYADAPEALLDAYDAACAVRSAASDAYQAYIVASFEEDFSVPRGAKDLVVFEAVSSAYWAAHAAVEAALADLEAARGR